MLAFFDAKKVIVHIWTRFVLSLFSVILTLISFGSFKDFFYHFSTSKFGFIPILSFLRGSKYFEKEKRIVIIRENLATMLEEGIGGAEIKEFKKGEKFIDVERLATEFAIFSDLYLEDESEILKVCNELFSYFSNSLTRELLKDPESWKQTLLNMQNISLNISQEEHKEILEEIS